METNARPRSLVLPCLVGLVRRRRPALSVRSESGAGIPGPYSAGAVSPRAALILLHILQIQPDLLGRRAWPAGRIGALGALP